MKWLAAIVVLTNVAGNLLLNIGVKTPDGLAIAAGIAILIVWTLCRMALMSWADLSYILPITSVGYILTALVGKYILGEHISAARWCGTVLIFAGMVVVSRTSPRTQS